MLKIPISASGREISTVKHPFNANEQIPMAIVEASHAPYAYGSPTIVHNIASGWNSQIWSYPDPVPLKNKTDVGTTIIEVPLGYDSICFLTTVKILATAGAGFVISTTDADVLGLLAYVPKDSVSGVLYPETAIGKEPLRNLMPASHTYKDVGGGAWEVVLRPVTMPVCGFKYVRPVFYGFNCPVEDKPKILEIKVWAFPAKTNYANRIL